jgi:large subunit ribosomal protein L6
MSRIGRKPIAVPAGVDVRIAEGTVSVKGKSSELKFSPHKAMKVAFDAEKRLLTVTRPNDDPLSRALHGLTRSLLNNMVRGVQTPFEKRLEIQGVGYTATVSGKVGQFAADVRAVRPPEPYKGKGIRYHDEVVRRKAGKAFAGSGSG